MKKIKVFMVMAAMAAATTVVTSCSNKDDIDKANQRIDQVENRLSTLEQQVNNANTNISSLQAMVSTLSNAEYVTAVTPTANGYTLTFRSGQTATIANGKDGADGATPQISVKQDADGNWYWTVNGSYLTDASGAKIRANGTQGEQGITPQVRINATSNEWEVSLDEGKTWTSLGVKATGEKGDAFFKSVTVGEDLITVVLADGTTLELPLFDSFKKVRDRVQSIVYVPEYADGMIAVEQGKDKKLTYRVKPAAMAYAIADQKDKLSFEGEQVQTRAIGASLTVKDVQGDASTGNLTVTVTPNGFTAGQYYAFALTFSDGISIYQTPFTTTFSVVEAESIRIGVLGLQAGMETVQMGSYLQLFVVWNPGYTTYKNVTWSSSDEKKAQVNSDGFVTVPGDAEDGSVTITAKTANGKEAKLVLTIADKKISINTDQLPQSMAE